MGVIANCGGLLYDLYERWIKGYIRKIGPYDDLHAEMRGLYIGLDMLWLKNISCLMIHIRWSGHGDSKILVDMIADNFKFNVHTPILVHESKVA